MSETCCYHGTYDLVTGEPTGEECGRPAVGVLFWDDGRFSPHCAEHGVEVLYADAEKSLLRDGGLS